MSFAAVAVYLALLTSHFSLSSSWAGHLMLDDFDDDKPANMLEGATGAWGDPGDKSVSCVATLDDKVRLGESGRSLRIDYDVDSARKNVRIPTNVSIQNPAQLAEDVYNGYYSILGGVDLRPYKFLVFWVKGDPEKGFTRSFKIELKDRANNAGVTVDGVTDQWQKMEVPLRRFKEITNWAHVREFVLVFGPALVTRKEGALHFDDVYFTDDPAARVRQPAERTAKAERAAKAPAVDGDLTDWPEASFVGMEDFKEFGESGESSGQGDIAAWFGASWDDENLYLAMDVQDGEVLNAETPENLWKGDCVEVYLEPTGEGFVWGDARRFQLGFAPASANKKPAAYAFFQKRVPGKEEMRQVIKAYKDGYQLEAAVSWEFLGFTPAPGQSLGFSVAVHDRDSRDSSADAKLNWNFIPTEPGKVRLGKLVLQ